MPDRPSRHLVLHVEDNALTTEAVAFRCAQRAVAYVAVDLISLALGYVERPDLGVMIVDSNLPLEREGWTSERLILHMRMQRPDVPVIVCSAFPGPAIDGLIREGILSTVDVLYNHDLDLLINIVVGRLYHRCDPS